METLEHVLSQSVTNFLTDKFGLLDPPLEFQATRKDFEGDITFVLFPLLKLTHQNPAVLGAEIGAFWKNIRPKFPIIMWSVDF